MTGELEKAAQHLAPNGHLIVVAPAHQSHYPI
jgi:16S rRNA G1207 methylase RsmC